MPARPDPRWVTETDDFEKAVMDTLSRIYLRDGPKVFEEAAKWMRADLGGWIAACRRYKGWPESSKRDAPSHSEQAVSSHRE